MARILGETLANGFGRRKDPLAGLIRPIAEEPMAQQPLLFLEVLVLEDVRRCPYQPKADFLLAGFAVREMLAADHDDLVGLAMFTVVDDFVDAGLANDFSGPIASAAIRLSAAVARSLDAS
jgi:hypothetical protein